MNRLTPLARAADSPRHGKAVSAVFKSATLFKTLERGGNLMFRKKTSERCAYCRKFLSPEQMSTGICLDCAQKAVAGIKQSIKIRVVIGMFLMAVLFVLIHYLRVNSFEYGTPPLSVMRSPAFGGYLTYNVRTFNGLINTSLFRQILLGILFFLIPFAKRVRFGVGNYYALATNFNDTKERDKSHASDHPYVIAARSARGGADRAGLLFCELFLSAISGPVFFVHRIYTLVKLSSYLNAAPNS